LRSIVSLQRLETVQTIQKVQAVQVVEKQALASEIFLSSLPTEFFSNLMG